MAGLISDDILDALEQRESSGNPKAYNKASGAMGAYQFLPSTVEMLSKKHGSFDPYNRDESRQAARRYLEDLVDQKGSLEGALAAYGGFKTKDPTDYINAITKGSHKRGHSANKAAPNVFTIEAPDGRKFRVTGNEHSTEDDALNFVKSTYYAEAKPEKSTGVLGAIARGGESLGSDTYTGLAGLFGDTNKAASEGLERQKKIAERYGEGLSFDKLKNTYAEKGIIPAGKELLGAIPEAIAEQSPRIAASLAGGAAGTALAGPIGGVAGALLPLLPGQAGSNLQRQVQEGQSADAGKAYAAAVPQVAIDVAADRFTLFGKGVLSKMLGQSEETLAKIGAAGTERLAKETLLKSIANGTIRGIATQVPTEVVQQAIERLQAGLDLTGDDALKEYGETAFQTSLTGPAGILGRRVDVGAAQRAQSYQPPQDFNQTVPETSPPDIPEGEAIPPPEEAAPEPVEQVPPPIPNTEQQSLDLQPPEELPPQLLSAEPIDADLDNTDTVRPRLFTESDLKEMGITKGNKKIRGLLGANLSDPAQAEAVKSYLWSYAQDPIRSAKLAEKVIDFHDKIDTYAEPTVPDIQIDQPTIEPSIQSIEPEGVNSPSPVGVTPLEGEGLASALPDVGAPTIGEAPKLAALEPTVDIEEEPQIAKLLDPLANPIYAQKNLSDPAMSEAIRNQMATDIQQQSLIKQDREQDIGILDAYIKRGELHTALNHIQTGDKGSAAPAFDPLSKILAGRLRLSPNIKDVKLQMVESLPDDAIGAYDRNTDTVYMTPEGLSSPDTLLHETLHAATAHAIDVHQNDVKPVPAVAKLTALYHHVLDEEPALKHMYKIDDLHEFVAKSMSNPSLQKRLADIDYEREGALPRFVKSILDIFGIKPTRNQSSLAESLVLGGDLVAEGRHYLPIAKEHGLTSDRLLNMQLTPSGKEAKEFLDTNVGNITHAAPTDPNINDNSTNLFFKSFVDRDSQGLKEAARKAWTGFRVSTFKQYASVEEKLIDKYAGGWRDANGSLRGDMLSAQAQDYKNLAISVANTGGLKISDNGFLEAVDLPNGASIKSANDGISKLGTKLGSLEVANKLFTAWATANRAEELKRTDPVHYSTLEGMPTEQQIQNGLKLGQMHPELQNIQNTFRSVLNSLIDANVQAGRLSKDTASEWKGNLAYAPFFRVDRIDRNSEDSFKQSGSLSNPKTFKELKGGFNEIGDMATNYMELAQWLTATAVKNNAKLNTVEQLGAKVAKPGDSPELLTSVYRDGKQEWYRFDDPLDAQAWRMSISKSWPVLKAMRTVANLLRETITVFNPAFAVKQLIEDTQQAALLSGVKDSFGVASKTLAAFYNPNPDTKSVLYRNGIIGAYDVSSKSIKDQVDAMQNQKALSAFQQGRKVLTDWAERSDNAQRMAIYEQTMQETGDKAIALHRARNIINWSNRGNANFVNELTTIVPFLHSRMQSMDLLIQSLRGKGLHGGNQAQARKLLFKQAFKYAGLVAIYSMAVSGSDDYEKLTDEDKWGNFIIPGAGVKIPVSPGLPSIIKAAAEAAWGIVTTEGVNNPDDRMTILKSAGNAIFSGSPLNPLSYTPAAVKPIAEVKLNKSFFTGDDLAGAHLKTLEKSRQYTQSTTELGKLMSSVSGDILSPIEADHVLRGYLGILATITGSAVSMMSSNTPATEIKRMPVIKDFFYRDDSSGLKSKFYKLLEEVNTVNNTALDDMRQGRFDELEKLYDDPKKMALLMQKGAVTQIRDQLNNLRGYRNMVLNDGDLSSGAKRTKLTEIDQQETELLKMARASGIK